MVVEELEAYRSRCWAHRIQKDARVLVTNSETEIGHGSAVSLTQTAIENLSSSVIAESPGLYSDRILGCGCGSSCRSNSYSGESLIAADA